MRSERSRAASLSRSHLTLRRVHSKELDYEEFKMFALAAIDQQKKLDERRAKQAAAQQQKQLLDKDSRIRAGCAVS